METGRPGCDNYSVEVVLLYVPLDELLSLITTSIFVVFGNNYVGKSCCKLCNLFGEAGIPVGFLCMSIGCATAPATVAGSAALANAEVLAGITLFQLFYPEAPTFYGSSATMMELRSGGITSGGLPVARRYSSKARRAKGTDI